MSRFLSARELTPMDDHSFESIGLRTFDYHSVREQESDIRPLFNHNACPDLSSSDEARAWNISQHPWIARLRSYRKSRKNAWKTAMIANISITLLILLFNASFFLIAAGNSEFTEGYLYGGPCQKIETFAMLSHMVINIFGTLLLSASNYTMQILASPSRDDINSAHIHGVSLSIGVQSMKNLKFVGYTRLAIWIARAVASIPLHLLYNSTVFTTTQQSAYVVAAVTSDFEQGAPFDLELTNKLSTNAPIPTPEAPGALYNDYHSGQTTPDRLSNYEPPRILAKDQGVLLMLQDKARNKKLRNVTDVECFSIYSSSPDTNFAHVLAVSSNTSSNNSILRLDRSSSTTSSSNWICDYESLVKTGGCDLDRGPWLLGLYAKHNDTDWKMNGYPISNCLVEPAEAPCLLRYNTGILIIVLVANVVKLVAMVATMFQYRQPVLATVGDALASFLETPDYTTRQMCFTGKGEFDSEIWTTGPKKYLMSKTESQRSSNASQLLWAITGTILISSFMGGAICILLVYDDRVGLDWISGSLAKPGAADLGRGLPESILICLANLPQLVLSLNYMLCNRLMTCMAGAREWSMFAHQKKGLRTSQPRGSQRSAYWLQLPLRFSLPMMVVSSLLHYVASQSIQFGSMKYYDYPGTDGKLIVLEDKSGLGYSQTATHVLLILLILAFAAIVVWGQRYNQLGIPPCGFNSAAISAACHPPSEEEEPHLKPVQWGAIPINGDRDEVGHCSFSSGEVMMPIEGRMYM